MIRLGSDNPIEILERWFGVLPAEVAYITYSPSVVPQYHIIRGFAHDGTLAHTIEIFRRALVPLYEMTSTFIPTEPQDWDSVIHMEYTVGSILHEERFEEDGCVDLACGRFHGFHEQVSIPVRVEYFSKEGRFV